MNKMPCSATAEELRTDAGTKPSGMPQAPMSLREIAEAFVKHEDADVVGVVFILLDMRDRYSKGAAKYSTCGAAMLGVADSIIEFVEAQNEG